MNAIELKKMSNNYVRLLLQDNHIQPDLLLKNTDLDVSNIHNSDEITVRQWIQIHENMDKYCPDSNWALKTGSRFSINAHGPCSIAALTAPTLGESIDIFARFIPIRIPYLNITSHVEENESYLVYETVLELGKAKRHIIDRSAMVQESFFKTFLGTDIGEMRLEVDFPAPDNHEYIQWLESSVSFNHDRNRLIYPTAWRQTPSPLNDPELYLSSVAQCQKLMQEFSIPQSVPEFVQQRISLTAASLIVGKVDRLPTLEEIAEELHLHRRTLMRRLQEVNTSYNQIIDSTLRDQAEQLLSNLALTITEVSSRLGYQDTANFSRACRRWFGISPGKYRKHLCEKFVAA